MWVATTDEEANFVFDLLADREDERPVLDYARWLEERGESVAAEYLRLGLSPRENEQRLRDLRPKLDPRWLGVVTGRRFRRGDIVHITGGQCEGIDGRVADVDTAGGRAGLFLHLLCSRDLIWVAFEDLRLLKGASDARDEES